MNEVEKTENYLRSLEQALQAAPAGRRSEIVLEVKGQLETVMAKTKSLDQALNEIGSVASVCHRYGYVPTSAPSGVRWFKRFLIVIFFVFIFVAGIVSMLVWKVKQVSDEFDSSGGLHFFDHKWSSSDEDDQFLLGGNPLSGNDEEAFLIEETKPNMDRFVFKFSSGKIRLSESDTEELKIRCKIQGLQESVKRTESNREFQFDLSQVNGAKCDISVPQANHVTVEGINGDVQVIKPKFHLDLTMANGRIQLEPSRQLKYKYKLSVKNGRMEEFYTSPDSDAFDIKIDLTNGYIARRRD